MKKQLMKLLLRFVRPVLKDLVLSIVIPKLEKEAAKSSNDIDDEVIRIVKEAITNAL